MAINQSYLDYITDQLSVFGNFETKKMFGGIGFFREGKMFAMIGGDTFRLKVDDDNKQDYIDNGMKPYVSKGKKKGMPYWEVPTSVIEDKKALSEWASKSYAAAVKAKK
ncbi:MAG: TfoX/Sxy family protein [Saprospiraceae bacterium]|nr:TfoX/Sxy family protein [Saprospiraceae bacterium]